MAEGDADGMNMRDLGKAKAAYETGNAAPAALAALCFRLLCGYV